MNPQICEQYLADVFPNQTTGAYFFSADILRRLMSYEALVGKSVESSQFNKSDYLSFFLSSSISTSNTFRIYRSRIKHYLNWAAERGFAESGLDAILDSMTFEDIADKIEYAISYFPTLDALMDEIEATLAEANPYDDRRYDIGYCHFIFAWYGVPMDSLPDILQSDLKEDGVVVNGELVQMDERAMKIIRRYALGDGYFVMHTGEVFNKYADSIYLFRTQNRNKITRAISNSVTRDLNSLSDDEVSSLTYTRILKSGLFARVRAWELEAGRSVDDCDCTELNRLFHADYPMKKRFWSLLKDYRAFVKFFKL